jgi:hypothetical protein
MEPPVQVNTKSVPLPTRRLTAILADNSKTLPKRIEYLKAGKWPQESNKGELSITLADLYETKQNFDNGIGIPAGLKQLPIDYKHEEWDKAAAWVTAFEVDEPTGTLFADLDWTPAGREAVLSGEFKCFSPAFYPACRGEWHDPENWNITATNVAIGGGLTNIPFFKGLTAITASNDPRNVIFVSEKEEIKEIKTMPTLAEVLDKEVDQLTDDDKKIIADNANALTADQRKKYGYEVKPVAANNKPAPADPIQVNGSPEIAKFIASINSGESVVVKATEYKALTEQVDANNKELEQIRLEKVQAMVETHHARGAIKSDRIEPWVKRVMADATMEDELKALPDNADHAKQRGQNDAGAGDVTSASAQFEKKVSELMEADKDLEYSAAVIKAANANPDLSKQRDQELRNR